MSSNEEINSALRTYFREKSGRVLGAQLGAFLKSRFPEFDYRAQHRNLKAFLDVVTEGKVHVIGKHGPDDILELAPAAVGLPETPLHVSTSPIEESAWKLFINPNMSGNLKFDVDKKKLFVSDRVSDIPNCVGIERITDEEQRAMMRAFTEMYSAREEATAMRQALETDDGQYWQRFFTAVQRAGLTKRWLNFRRETLVALLRQRLLSAGVEEGKIPSTAGLHKRDPFSERLQTDYSSKRDGALNSSISHLAQAAISNLSDEQIRALPIPFGAVWDALQKRY